MGRLCDFLFASMAFVVVLAVQGSLLAQQKSSVPDAAAQATAKKMAADIYADRFAEAKKADEKATLAAEMIDAALKVQDGLPGQYVLLTIARDVAAGAGDAANALKAVGELANRFEIETARMQGETLLRATSEASTTAQRNTVTKVALDVIGTLRDADEYELALEICEEARTVATRTREYAIARALSAKEAELKQAEEGSRGYREALAILDRNPIDSDANLAAGKYLCFVKGDWHWGTPMLALGSDVNLKAAAVRDLRGSDSGEGQMALGDTWWDLAQGMTGPQREAILVRAGSWYRQAEPKLAGDLRSLKLKQRLEEIGNLGREIPEMSEAPPLAIAPFDAQTAKQHQIAWSRYLKVPVVYTHPIGLKLVLIPPGEFEMGSTKEETERILSMVRDRNGWMSGFVSAESPPHRVTITKPFYLGTCEVTQQQYLRVMGGDPQQFKRDPNRPAANVTWHNATEFCRRLSELAPERGIETTDFRLPTEAEWEYACRAGTVTRYYFGDDPAMLPRCAWFYANANAQPRPVAQLTPNAWGLFDMYGNVCEWCTDTFARYNSEPATDPEGPSSGQGRVLRGLASVDKDAAFFRSAFRHHRAPDFRADQVGLRVVMTISH